MRISLVALMVLAAAPALAGGRAPSTNTLAFTNSASANKYNLLEAQTTSGAAGARTITLATNRNWGKLSVLVFFTHDSATTVTTTYQCSFDGTNYGLKQTRAIASGVATLNPLIDTKAVTGDAKYQLEVDVRGCQGVKLILGGAGAVAGDTVDVQVMGIAGE